MKSDQQTTDPDADAAAWYVRLHGGDASLEDWNAFTKWLERSSANRDSYRAVSLADDLVEGLPQATDSSTGDIRPDKVGWAPWAIAASLAVTVAIPLATRTADPIVVEATSGQYRVVTIRDGTRIALNGASRVQLDPDNPRRALLSYGEALFTVQRDEARPFVVRAGGLELRQAGTQFNVRIGNEQIEVAVSEGAVIVNPDNQGVALVAGQALHAAAGSWSRRRVDPASIGGWRFRELAYENASLATVAADLAAMLGREVEVDPSLVDRRFTGVLIVEPADLASVESAATVIGARATRRPDGSILLSQSS